MKKILVLISISYILFACSGSNKKVENYIQKDYKSELDQFFKTNYDDVVISKIKGIQLDSLHWIHRFYKTNNYATIWINDSIQLKKEGNQLIDQLSKAKNYGLDTRLYATNALLGFKKKLDKNLSKKDIDYSVAVNLEVLLTYYFMQHGKQLNYGVLGSIDSLTILPRKSFTLDLPKYLYQAYRADSIITKLLDLQPKQPQYHSLQKGLERFLQKTSLSTKSINVQNFRIDSLKAIRQAKKSTRTS